MNTIEIKAKENLDNAEYLHPQDIIFCENIFAEYNDHFRLFSGIVKEINGKFITHKNNYSNWGAFTRELDLFSEALEDNINVLPKLLKVKVAATIANYFNTEYSLSIDVDIITDKCAKSQFESYHAILDDIVGQVGKDFPKIGRLRIIKRFQRIFISATSQPVLHGCKISFPTLGSYNVSSFDHHITLRDGRDSISKLLDAIALYSLNVTKRPATFTTQVQEWRREIDCKVDYNLLGGEHDVSLKFFRNQRVDLIWLNKKNAQNFWKLFELENITAQKRNGNTC